MIKKIPRIAVVHVKQRSSLKLPQFLREDTLAQVLTRATTSYNNFQINCLYPQTRRVNSWYVRNQNTLV